MDKYIQKVLTRLHEKEEVTLEELIKLTRLSSYHFRQLLHYMRFKKHIKTRVEEHPNKKHIVYVSLFPPGEFEEDAI